jgi:hypothetical protein
VVSPANGTEIHFDERELPGEDDATAKAQGMLQQRAMAWVRQAMTGPDAPPPGG